MGNILSGTDLVVVDGDTFQLEVTVSFVKTILVDSTFSKGILETTTLLIRAAHYTVVYSDGRKVDSRCMVHAWPITNLYP